MLRIALVSKTGNGKSSLGNLLLGREVFGASESFASHTVENRAESGVVDGRQVTIVDTPGTMDTKDPMAAMQELSRMILLSPEGFHAFLIVVRCDVRFTNEENEAIEALRRLFGDKFLNFSIIVFTHGDAVKNDNDRLQQMLSKASEEMKNLLHLCDHRMALVENDRRLVDEQVQRRQIQGLMTQIEQLAGRNGGLYTDAIFKVAQQEEKRRRKREEERQEAEEMLKKRLEAAEKQNKRHEEQRKRERRFRSEMQDELQQLQQKHQQEREQEQEGSRWTIAKTIAQVAGSAAVGFAASRCSIQ